MPGQAVVLDTMGGLVATARAEDIPEGASPRTYDTDYIVGRVIQRAGEQSVYTFEENTFGPNNGGVATDLMDESNPWANSNNILLPDGNFTTSNPLTNLTTDQLQITSFNFTIPSTETPVGIEVAVKGFAPGATLFAQLMKGGVLGGELMQIALPTSNSFVILGDPSTLWGWSWLYSDLDATNFGVVLWVEVENPATVALDACQVTVYCTEAQTNFLGLVSANLDSIDLTTLALDAMGLVWQEDVSNNPNILVRAGLIPQVVPGSYMKGLDAGNGMAYMAYSDLTQGTSQPMQYNGQWCDRITQVGPGQAPTFTPQIANTDTFAISTITQPPVGGGYGPRTSSYFLQSSGVGVTSAGNNVTVYYDDDTVGGGHPDTILVNAFNSGQPVYIYMTFTGTGIPTQGPYVIQVTSVGLAQPPGQPRQFNYFTYTLPTSAAQYYKGSTSTTYTVTYQMSVATLTTSVPVPGLTVGNQITVSGATPSAWDSTWTITQLLNSGSVSITQTSVTGGVATYDYTLITGVAPTAGQLITITNTLNDNGALNGANLVIASSTGGASGSFTVTLSVPDATPVAETGQGVTAGTIFNFDPGAVDVGTSTNPIFGNGTGGTLTFQAAIGTVPTPGIKQGTCFFISRNGAVTQPANPVTFTIPSNTQGILATQIPVGPPNVEYVGISFTESGQNQVPGANFYTYDTPVTYTVQGIQYTASALIVPNGTTSATFTFPDSVLLASDEIDIQGNNYFNLREIGSPTWMRQYADRMQYGLCQTKIDNFINLTFDGGYNPAPSPQPLGWTAVLPPAGVSAGLVISPDFGDSLQILNTSGATVNGYYLYYQSAYQDFYNVNILQPETAYSIRFKARALNADGQSITMSLADYTSGAFGVPRGTVTFTVNQGDFTIQTAQILVSQATIDPNLQLAIQIGSIANGAGVQIDRIEIFPTDHPIDTTIVWESYAGEGDSPNFEAVDRVTGQLGCGDDNPQPAQGSYQILEQLYIEKTNSRCVTQDSPNFEPNQWNVPLASQGVGAVGPNAFHSEEEFSVSVSRSGIFVFDGGKPMPISRELQSTGVNASLWEKINWAAAKTIWCRYSTVKRQLYVGVPMITPNFWLPNAPAATPTSPNVILMCNFTGCPTAGELADSPPVHTTMFGDLKALDMRRKWSLWQIACPVAEFVTRQDGVSSPLFLCNGIASSKIYQLIDGAASGGQNTDDGAPINWLYTTYGFTKAKQGQQVPGLGALRKVWYFFVATMEGIGQVSTKLYSNTLGALLRNTWTIPAFTLASPQQDDQEAPLEIGGQRLFVEFTPVGTGGYAEVGPIILDGEMDRNAPHRGVSA
jgi:hypothetical protein